jgi:site-specific recombinase XerD
MLGQRVIFINRLKGSQSGNHLLHDDEIAALSTVKSRYPHSYFVFANERGQALTVAAIQKIVSRAGASAGLQIKIHPHMFRHACGYFLAEQGAPTRESQNYLGHTNIQHTVRYTAQNPKRFERFDWSWEESN